MVAKLTSVYIEGIFSVYDLEIPRLAMFYGMYVCSCGFASVIELLLVRFARVASIFIALCVATTCTHRKRLSRRWSRIARVRSPIVIAGGTIEPSRSSRREFAACAAQQFTADVFPDETSERRGLAFRSLLLSCDREVVSLRGCPAARLSLPVR